MRSNDGILLVQNLGNAGKLAVLAGVCAFAGLLYIILPKLMNSKLRSYYDQLDQEDEEEAEPNLPEEDKKNDL